MAKDQITFQTHPLKDDIVRRWESGEPSQAIFNWLEKEHPELRLSLPTLCKHHRNYKKNANRIDTGKEIKVEPNTGQMTKIEDILWSTVKQCQKLKKDKTLSAKEWQYIDQQQQAAIDKIMRIGERSGDTRDISVLLSEMFKKMELGEDFDVADVIEKDISEQEKLKIVAEVDKENAKLE